MKFPSHAHVIVIPAYNRREITLAALAGLAADDVFAWATILIMDDGSTDGTSEAVARSHPAAAILRGDGSWWWGGAIRRGMEWALRHGAQSIYWLNDDCRPPPGGLAALREFSARDNRVAWIEARAPGGWSYGGYLRTAWGLRRCRPDEEAQGNVETFSGNCVCLPRGWIERVGLPHDSQFPHGLADLDYGLRLHASGAELKALPGVIAENANPARSAEESWLGSSRRMRDIWRDFDSPRSFLHFPAWRRFALRHWGLAWGWVVFALPYVRWFLIAVVRGVAPGAARSVAARRRAGAD